jgi:hypothetical protein
MVKSAFHETASVTGQVLPSVSTNKGGCVKRRLPLNDHF